MRAIIIEDKDAKALIQQLELSAFHQKQMDSPTLELVPERTRHTLIEDIHKRFHYVVWRWLEQQGASTI